MCVVDLLCVVGPRMLERALASYDSSSTASEHPVWVAPPDLFYPKFDPGALGEFIHLLQYALSLRLKICAGR